MKDKVKEKIEPKKNRLVAFFRLVEKLLFNKIFYYAVAILIQVLWFLLLYSILTQYYRRIEGIVQGLTVLIVLTILNRKINPSYKLAWTLIILPVPVFGLMIYFLFGNSRVAKRFEKQFEKVYNQLEKYMQEDPGLRQKLEEKDQTVARQSQYITDYAKFPVHTNTTAEYFQVGDDMFPVLLSELSKAKHYIFIEYFIINTGVMWDRILEILEQKAKEGVDVRIIYDGFGCITTLPSKYTEVLKKKNIKAAVFNPFYPILNIAQNNRDHRKLCIIDGYVGFTGGINLADEYINAMERFGHWKDTAVMLRGDAVWNMTAMFLHMWMVINPGQGVDKFENYLPHRYHLNEFKGEGYIQPFSDSPLDHETVGENVYLNIINRARKYVYICTPYLIIDNEMMTALCIAAKSGVDVRIMTPGIPDKKMVFLLTQSYYEQLIECGVKIYEYQPGFLHSKTFVCDDEIGVVGTINMDYRSLYLHFEDGVWIYNNPVIEDIRKDFDDTLEFCEPVTLEFCEPVTLEFCRNRKIPVRAMQSILRIAAPLM